MYLPKFEIIELVMPMAPFCFFYYAYLLTYMQPSQCTQMRRTKVGYPQWCKPNVGLGIETMVWVVPIVPFWLFYYKSSLTYVRANAHYFADTAHEFPQCCKI
jgi:hypothetical protein